MSTRRGCMKSDKGARVYFHGPLQFNFANPRYFTDGSGEAIYLTGSHTWAVMQDMWSEGEKSARFDYDGFLAFMKKNGHNFLRFWQWMYVRNAAWSEIPTHFAPHPFMRTGPGKGKDGLPKFDLSVWNEDYFKRLRERIEKAHKNGIYVSIMLFEAWGIKNATSAENDPWPYHPMNPDNNVNGITDNPVLDNGWAWDFYSLNCQQLLHWQKEYIKKIMDTVNEYDNVLYEICNEVPCRKEAKEWQEHLCAFVKAYQQQKDTQHPVGITACDGEQNNEELFHSNADWISPGIGLMGEYKYNPPEADGKKVVVTDTDHLWGHGGDFSWVWKSFTRGMNVIFMDAWEPIPGDLDWWKDGNISKNQPYYYQWDPIRRNMGYTKRFADRMNLNACVPRKDLCTSTYCLAHEGEEYLCYFPEGGAQGLSMWGLEGEFQVEWLNPYTGITYKGKHIKGNKRCELQAPFEGPSVVYLWKLNT